MYNWLIVLIGLAVMALIYFVCDWLIDKYAPMREIDPEPMPMPKPKPLPKLKPSYPKQPGVKT